MRTSLFLAAAVLISMTPGSLRADYLKNGDMKDRLSNWHGDGEAAFLAPDGTEGAEGDKGVIPVIKLALSKGQPRYVSQDYEAKDNPSSQRIHVEIYASADYKRSKFDTDYTPNIAWKADNRMTYWGMGSEVPKVDFWIRLAFGYEAAFKLADIKPSQWMSVDGRWEMSSTSDAYSVSFIVPPGEGAIYIRKATADK